MIVCILEFEMSETTAGPKYLKQQLKFKAIKNIVKIQRIQPSITILQYNGKIGVYICTDKVTGFHPKTLFWEHLKWWWHTWALSIDR